MPTSAAPRTGITRWSAEADPFDRTQLDADHALLDDLVGIDLHDGLLAARPAVGIRGRYFTESAASAGLPGTTWREDGTAWRALGSRVLSTGTTDVAQIVAGVTGQTGNLQEWRAGASTLGHVDNTGQLFAVGAQLGPSPQTALAAMLGVTPTSAAAIAAIVRGAASQSADLQQWQSNAGTVLARVDSVGVGTFAGLTTAGTMTGRLARWSSAAVGDVPVQVTGFAGQTGDLQQWRDSTGTVLGKVTSSGGGQFSGAVVNMTTGSQLGSSTNLMLPGSASQQAIVAKGLASQSGDLQQWQSSAAAMLARINSAGSIATAGTLTVGASGATVQGGAGLQVNPYTSGVIGAIVQGIAGQSVDLQQWQTSAGTVLARIDQNGAQYSVASFINTGYIGSRFAVIPNGPTDVGAIVRGVASQSADLQQWQTSAGAVAASVNFGGTFVMSSGAQVLPPNVSATPLTVKGLASQSADLTQWQDSTGAVRAKMTSGAVAWLPIAHIGDLAADPGAFFNVVSNNAGATVAVIRGAASQTNDLLQWQSSAGTVLGKVPANGDLYVQALCVGPLGQAGSGVTSTFTTQLRPFDAGKRGLNIQGQVSQTAELTLWSNSAGTTIAAVTASGNVQGTGAYTTLSDASMKRNVRGLPHDSALAVINRLRPQLFDFIDGERDQVGFVAQQVAEHLPHAVVPFSSSGDDRWSYDRLGVRSEAIVAYLVRAVQELAAAA